MMGVGENESIWGVWRKKKKTGGRLPATSPAGRTALSPPGEFVYRAGPGATLLRKLELDTGRRGLAIWVGGARHAWLEGVMHIVSCAQWARTREYSGQRALHSVSFSARH